MEKENFDKELENIQQEFVNKKSALWIKYAKSNNPHKIGDIIKDHKCKIRIEIIEVTFRYNSDYPECKYFGIRLKRDNTAFKNGEKEYIFQSNIKS